MLDGRCGTSRRHQCVLARIGSVTAAASARGRLAYGLAKQCMQYSRRIPVARRWLRSMERMKRLPSCSRRTTDRSGLKHPSPCVMTWPARCSACSLSQLTCDTCWTQFVATLLGLAAYITDHESELGLIWITAAIAYAAVIVYSVIVVVPFVNRLEAHAPDCTSSVSAAPLQRFSALHLWRTLFGTIGFALFVADAVIRR